MRGALLAVVLLVLGASVATAQEAHGVALVRVVVVKAVASGEVAGSRVPGGTTVTGSASRQLRVASDSPVFVSTAVQGAAGAAAKPAGATAVAGGAGQAINVPLASVLRAAEAAQARSVTVSVVVN